MDDNFTSMDFEDPVVPPQEPRLPSADGSYDLDDRSHVTGLREQALLPSSMVDPRDVYGDEWDMMSVVDPEAAYGRFSVDWDFDMTVGQKMMALSGLAFRKRTDALLGEFSQYVAKPPVDPLRQAQDILMRRMERKGR